MKFYLKNGSKPAELAHCSNAQEAFNMAIALNREDRSANWKAYTERGDIICGLYQSNASGKAHKIMAL